ncbi:hypothetical protein AAFC00_005876 [Neodothiora populina]|uniref:Uncharacterized protein n=1 Tax=Neodothiora populina TaxID=2781224 RepID=A0ABR3P7G7_9PEZI
MTTNPPTLINLPPHDASVTPSDVPGTPNSATTSMSELSTVAIKDGHRGHLPHTSHPSFPASNNLDAERADRISRLAGLERVATTRSPSTLGNLTPGAAAPPPGTSGYFDAQGNPTLARERSTVGSASATGSVGGRTTWASGSVSDVYDRDHDRMSESQDMDGEMEVDNTSSIAADDRASDTNSLVGFGEGARTPARHSGYGSPGMGKATPTAPPPPFPSAYARDSSLTPVSAQTASERRSARYLDGMTYDPQVVDTVDRTPEPRYPMGGGTSSAGGLETAQRIVQERLGAGEEHAQRAMESPDMGKSQGRELGKFYFENR